MKLIVVKKQALQSRQIAERSWLYLDQTIVMKIELLQPRQPRERTGRYALDPVLVQIEYPKFRQSGKRVGPQMTNLVVVQQKSVQIFQPMEGSRTYVGYVVEPQISENKIIYVKLLIK